MPSRRPDERYRDVLQARRTRVPPADDREHALYDILDGKGTEGDIAYAHETHASEFRREILQAWIVTGASDEQIYACLRIPVAVVAAYRHIFFDLTAFRDDLELFDWVNSYGGTPAGKALLQTAVMNGVTGLMWMYGRGDVKVDPKTVMYKGMVDAHFRANAGRLSNIASPEAEAAHKHLKTAMTAATQLAKGDTGNLLADLLIRLQHRDMTTPITEEQSEDILH